MQMFKLGLVIIKREFLAILFVLSGFAYTL